MVAKKSKTKADEKPKFTCKRATIHFIYSFCVKTESSYLLNPKELFLTSAAHQSIWRMDPLKARSGIVPHLTIQQDSTWRQWNPENGILHQHHYRYKAVLNRLMRVFPVGGTFCASIEIKPKKEAKKEEVLDNQAIMALLGMIGQRESKEDESTVARKAELWLQESGGLRKRKSDKPREKTIHPIFYDSVRTLCEQAKLTWIDKEVIDVRKETQSPWVVTVLEVDGAVADAFCSPELSGAGFYEEKMARVKAYESQIAPIVFRAVSEDFPLEPTYLNAQNSASVSGLSSLNVDARLFVSVSRRSILCICRDKDQDPAKYFLPSLLDICELIRMRWHMLIVMNKLLDITIRTLRKEGEKKDRKPEDELREMMNLREWLATCLEDPGIYSVAGDALSQIYQDQRKTFRLDELQQMLLGKIDLMDRMYRDLVQLRWLKTSEED